MLIDQLFKHELFKYCFYISYNYIFIYLYFNTILDLLKTWLRTILYGTFK